MTPFGLRPRPYRGLDASLAIRTAAPGHKVPPPEMRRNSPSRFGPERPGLKMPKCAPKLAGKKRKETRKAFQSVKKPQQWILQTPKILKSVWCFLKHRAWFYSSENETCRIKNTNCFLFKPSVKNFNFIAKGVVDWDEQRLLMFLD